MSSLPSTRDVLATAAAASEHRSADMLLVLVGLEQDLGWEDIAAGLCTEHQAVANRLAELHLLVDQLAANLRGGHGVPPTPHAAPARKGMRPVVHLKQQAGNGSTTPSNPADGRRGVNKSWAKANGLLTLAQAIALTGYSPPGFSNARAQGRIPKPHSRDGNHPLWLPAQLAGIKPLRASRRERA